MAKGLEINIDVKFNKDKVTTLQNLIKNIEKKGITLNINTSKAETSLNSLMNKIKELQKVANNINVNWNNLNLNNNNNKNIEQLNKEKEILNQVITAKKNSNEVSKSSGIKESDLQSYDKLQQKLNEIINSEKQLSSVTMKTDNIQNLTSAVIKYKNELGQAITEQWKLITDKETNTSSFINTSSTVSDNVSSKTIEDTNKMYQKIEENKRKEAEKTANELNRIERERQQLIEQIENKRLQSTQRVKQEELSLQQIQAKFSNKALEQNYKEREDAIERIENKRIQAIQKAREEEIKLQRTQAQASNKALEQNYKEKQTTLYNEINNLLKEQYRIEVQLITADGERKQTLQQNLGIIKQSLATKSNNKEELLTQQQLNNLLNTEIQLKRNLETAQATKNDKVNQELINTRELIQLSQKQLNNQLNGVQNRNGNLVNTSFLGQLKEALKGNEITNQIDQIRVKINALNGTSTKEVRNQVANLKAEIVELDQKAKMNGLQVGQRQFSSFGQAISSTLSKFGIFLTTATTCRRMIQEIKEGIEYVKYLDESFTDMAMTMEISRSQFNDMSEDIDELATKLGVTSQYVHDIARVYSNASTTIEEVMKKVKGASELANISGMDGLETTKAIQSITNQFKLMQKEGADAGKVTSHIGDILVSISQNMAYDFASGIQEMNNAISTSGSVAEMSGDGLERYTATIGALIEQTGRTGEELANAYKMISARVLQIKSVAEDAGVNDEDMSKAQKALEELNIDIEKSTGDLKPLNEILQEVASKWEGLTDVEKQYTSEMLAGNRQRSTFVALMESMTRQQELYNDALNSDGALEEANEIKAKSIEGLTNTLKTQTNVMWSSLINSNMIKGFITGMTTVVNTISTAIENFGAFNTTLTLISTALLIFKGKTLLAFESGIWKGFIADLYKCVVGESALTVTTTGLELAFERLKLTILSNPLGAIAIAVTTVATAFSYFSNKAEEAKRKVEELAEANKSFNEDYGSKINNISNAEKLLDNYKLLSNELKSLQSGTDEYKDKEEKLKNTQEQLVSIYPEINDLLNENYDNKSKLIDKTQELIDKDKELTDSQARETLSKNDINSYNDLEKIVNKYKDTKAYLDSLIKADNDNLRKSFIYWNDSNGNQQGKYFAGSKDIKEAISETTKDSEKYSEAIMAIVNAYQVLDQQGTQYEGLASKSAKLMRQLGIDTSNLSDKSNDYADNIEKLNEALNKLISNQEQQKEEAQSNFKDTIEKIKESQEIINNINENGLTVDTQLKLLELYPELATRITDSAYCVEFLNNKIKEQGEIQKQAYLDMLDVEDARIQQQYNAVKDDEEYFNAKIKNSEAYKNYIQKVLNVMNQMNSQYYNANKERMEAELSNSKSLAQSKLLVEKNLTSSLAQLYKEYMTTTIKGLHGEDVEVGFNWEHGVPETEAGKQALAKYHEAKKYYEDLLEEIEKTSIDLDNINFDGIGNVGTNLGDSSSNKKDYSVDDLENLYDRYLKINTAIDMLNNNLEILKEKQDNLVGSDYLNSLKQEINSYKEQQDLIKQKISEQEKERWDLRVKLNDAGFRFYDWDINSPIVNYESQLKALTDSANAMADSDEKSAEAKKKAQERVKDLNEAIKDYNALISQTIPNTQKEWESLNNSIKEVYKTMSDLVADGENKIYDIFEYYADKKTEKIESQLDLLEEVYNKEKEREDLASKQSELAKIKEQMNLYELDSSANGKAKFKELQDQYDELLKEMNSSISETQFNNVKEQMENEKQAIEDSLKPENINSLINKALTDGFIKVGNETINLNNAINDMVSNTTIGFQNIIKGANEYNDVLKNVMATVKDIGISSINSNLGYDTSAITTAINNSTTNKSNAYTINIPITVEGNLDNITLNDIEATATQIANTQIQKLINDMK